MARRESKTISFTKEQVSFVNDCVAAGRYQSASEVVREGLRLLAHDEALRQAQLSRAREMIAQGADELARGEIVEGESAIHRLRKSHLDLRKG